MGPRVRPRRLGKGVGDARRCPRPDRDGGARRGRRGRGVPGGLLVFHDEPPHGRGAGRRGGGAERLPDLGEEHGLRRLPPDGQRGDPDHPSRVRRCRIVRGGVGAAHLRRSGGEQHARSGDRRVAGASDQVHGRVDRPHRGGRAPHTGPGAPVRGGEKRRRHGAGLVEPAVLHARPLRHGSTRPHRQRIWQAVRSPRAQHRRNAHPGSGGQCRLRLPRPRQGRRHPHDERRPRRLDVRLLGR